MTKVEDARKLPTGWLAMSIGGTLGGAALGAFAAFTAYAYFDNQPDAGLEALGWSVMWTVIGCFLGAGAGASLALRWRGYDRATASGVAFTILLVVFLTGWAFFGAEMTQSWDEGLLAILALVTAIPSAAWLARRAVTSWGER
jgi:asparagine N-glycosylation enzyme membrane subunit Stt3